MLSFFFFIFELKSSWLYDKHLTHWAISPTPDPFLKVSVLQNDYTEDQPVNTVGNKTHQDHGREQSTSLKSTDLNIDLI